MDDLHDILEEADTPMSDPRTVRYVGGPLDGQVMDVSDWSEESVRRGVYQVVDGWVDRADYEPEPDGDPLVWLYRGPVPD